jgi:outer membrane protein OmpA-like peptidoglycan-associated protein
VRAPILSNLSGDIIMRRRLLSLAIASVLASPVAAQSTADPPPQPSDAVVPLSWVGSDTRVSIGIDDDGDFEGEAFQVFGNDGDSAWIGQGWIGRGGAGGAKLDYHWLWGGLTREDTITRPDAVTVAKAFVAVDQNAFEDRKLSVGFGLERERFFLDGYLSQGLTDERLTDTFVEVRNDTITGTQNGRPFTQTRTTTTTTRSFEQAWDHGVGARVGRFFDGALARVRAGLDYEWGDYDSDQLTLSAGVDKFFPGSGHSLSLELEHYERDGDFVLDDSDTRGWLFWRYDFGKSFRPTEPYAMREVRREVPVEKAGEPVVVRNEVRIDAESFFLLDRAELTGEAREALSGVVAALKSGQRVSRIEVSGHTCDLGPEAYNQALSERRATAVREFLAAQGVAVEEIDAVGRGELAPKYPNTRDERHRNRRVDIGFLTVEETTTAAPPVPATETRVEWVREPVAAPAPWIERALRNPAEHKRTVDVYRFETVGQDTTLGPVQFVNRGPVAVNDTATVRNDATVNVAVLANDSDPDGDTLTLVSIGTAANGVARIVGSSVEYAPNAGFAGVDSFTYVVRDPSGLTATARVEVTVTAVPTPNRAPIANEDEATTVAISPVVVFVLRNDVDPDGDPLTVVSATPGIRGQTVVNPDGSVTYTPNVDWCGTDFFTYTIRDPGGLTASARAFVRRIPPNGGSSAAKACPI